MIRQISFALALTLGATARLAAQHPTAHPAGAPKQDLKARWGGTWDGTYQSDHAPDGNIRLVLAQDSTWTGTLSVFMPNNTMSVPVSDVRFDDDKVTWKQTLMGQPCTASAKLDGATLKGETQCGHGGLMFVMTRK